MLTFKGIDSAGFGGLDLTDQLLYNLKFWIDWGLLHHGAFSIYRINDFSFYNDTEDKLIPVYDERFGNGHVWTGVGPEWVWESGVVASEPPFRVSGVYVNNAFVPVGNNGALNYHIDYQRSRVIFDNPQALDSDIRAEYTHRMVHVAFDDHPNFRQLIQNSIISQVSNTLGSGLPTRENQIHLPAIFIGQRSGTQRGLELGGGQIKTRNISFNIFADNSSDRNLLADWMDKQSRASFVMADINDFIFPFDQYGDIASGVLNWPQMASDFPGKKIRIMESRLTTLDSINPNIYRARVDVQVEIDIGGI